MAWPMLVLLAAAVALLSEMLGLLGQLVHSRGIRINREAVSPNPTLIVPLTGSVPGLEGLIDRLNRQTQPMERLIVSVESTADPAHERVRAIGPHARFPVDIVIAGTNDRRGQKCTNLIVAVRALAPKDRIVVFLDGDIQPQDWWLSTLIRPLAADRADAVSGYRWPVGALGLIPAIIAGLDRVIALLPGWRIGKLVWGGSVALRREALDAIDIPGLYDRVLSDDLTMGRAVHEGALRFVRRRALLLPTPMHDGAASAARFGVRQYRIMGAYRPWTVAGGFAVILWRIAIWSFLAVSAVSSVIAALTIALIALLCLAKWRVRHMIGARLDASDAPRAAGLQALVAVLQPAVDAIHLGIIATALSSRRVDWGHVSYDLRGPQDVAVLERRPYAREARESAQV